MDCNKLSSVIFSIYYIVYCVKVSILFVATFLKATLKILNHMFWRYLALIWLSLTVLTLKQIYILSKICVKLFQLSSRVWTVFLLITILKHSFPTNIYLSEVNNRKTRKRCKICSKITMKTSEQHHLFLVFLLLTWNK